MKNNNQDNCKTQSLTDLRLLLQVGPQGEMEFKTFHSCRLSNERWDVTVDIIGESHKVKVQNRESPSSREMKEVLACIEMNGLTHSSFYMEKLSAIKSGKVSHRIDDLYYKFGFEVIGFNDGRYKDALDAILKGAGNCISYDFSKERRDSFDDIYGPVTLVNTDVSTDHIKWNSLHIYPNDERAVISKSSLSINAEVAGSCP